MEKNTLESPNPQGSPSLETPWNDSAGSTSQSDSDSPIKRRRKSKLEAQNTSLWRNLSYIFSVKTSSSATVKVIKEKESPIRRLSSLFKLKKKPLNTIKPITNIGISPKGYQVAVSEANFQPDQDKNLAIAIRLPKGTINGNVAVTVEMEAYKGSDQDVDEDGDEPMILRCSQETDAKTIFTGIIKLPPHTDLAKLMGIPLYLIDSEEKMILNAGLNSSYETIIKSSEDLLSGEDENQKLVDDARIKLKLEIEKTIRLLNQVDETDAEGTSNSNEPEANNETCLKIRSQENMDNLADAQSTIPEIAKSSDYLIHNSEETVKPNLLTTNLINLSCDSDYYDTGANLIGSGYGSADSVDRTKEVSDKKATTDITKNVTNPTFEESHDVPESRKELYEDKSDEKEFDYESTDFSNDNEVGKVIIDEKHSESNLNNVKENDKDEDGVKDIIFDSQGYIKQLKAIKASSDDIMTIISESANDINELSVKNATTEDIRSILYESLNYIDELATQDTLSANSTEYVTNKADYTNEEETIVNNFQNRSSMDYVTELNSKNASTSETNEPVCNLNIKSIREIIGESMDNAKKVSDKRAATDIRQTLKVSVKNVTKEMSKDDRSHFDYCLLKKENDEQSTNYEGTVSQLTDYVTKGDEKAAAVKDIENLLRTSISSITDNTQSRDVTHETSIKKRNFLLTETESAGNSEENEFEEAVTLEERSRMTRNSNLSDLIWTSPYPVTIQKSFRDTSTQYSYTYFMDDKEVDAQSNLLTKDYNMLKDNYSSSRSLDNEFYLASGIKSVACKPSQTSNDESSAVTILPKSTTSTGTRCSDTLLSWASDTIGHVDGSKLKVPLNSPISDTGILSELLNFKSVQNTNKFTEDLNNIRKITLTYNPPKGDWKPLSKKYSNDGCANTLPFESTDNRSTPGDFSYPGDEPVSSNVCKDVNQNLEEPNNSDKTLELLRKASFKLKEFTSRENNQINSDDEPVKVVSDKEKYVNGNTSKEIRKSDLQWLNTPFDLITNRKPRTYKLKQDNNWSCYDDNDEYYERQRRDVRHYFEEEDYQLNAHRRDSDSAPTTKKNFDLFLGGDSSNRMIDDTNCNDPFYLHLKMKNTVTDKNAQPLITPNIFSAPAYIHRCETNTCECAVNSMNQKLHSEINELQRIYNDMCTRLDSQLCDHRSFINSKQFEQAKPEDSNTSPDVNIRYSNDIQSLQPTPSLQSVNTISSSNLESSITSSETSNNATEPENSNKTDKLSEERCQTYLNVENDIKRVIQELLKESGDIKETIILQGGKEEPEPPFSCEFITNVNEPDSIAVCKTILNNIVNISAESSNEVNQKSKNNTSEAQENVQHVLNALLEQVCYKSILNKNKLIESQTSNSSDILEAINFLFESQDNCSDLHIGDVNCINRNKNYVRECETKQNHINKYMTFFCHTTRFETKHPKTSFSFGEVPVKDLEIQNSILETPAKQRDGLTITGMEHTIRGSETSRLINELRNFNLQPDFTSDENILDPKSVTEDDVCTQEDKHCDARVTNTISQELEGVSIVSIDDSSTDDENKASLYTSNSEIISYSKINDCDDPVNSTKGNSGKEVKPDDTAQTDPSRGKDNYIADSKTVLPSSSNIHRSKKGFRLPENLNPNSASNIPSTSAETNQEGGTTEEEELIRNIDLEAEPELESVQPKASPTSGKVTFHYSSSDEEEIPRWYLRRSLKPNAIIEIKPKASVVSDSDSEFLLDGAQPGNEASAHFSDPNSHFVLRQTEAVPNIQNMFMNNTKEQAKNQQQLTGSQPTSRNDLEVSDADYEGDHDEMEVRLPNPKQRHKSKQDLNSPQEIAEIEKNVKENDALVTKTLKSMTASNTPATHEDIPLLSSLSSSKSGLSISLSSEASIELNVVNADNTEITPTNSTLQKAKPEPTI